MATFALPTGLSITRWASEFVTEFVRENPYFKYMGKGERNVINVNKDLAKQNGERLRIPYAKKLGGTVVTGSTALLGNETAFETAVDEVVLTLRRKAVIFGEDQTYKTDLDLLSAAKSSLVEHASKSIGLDIGTALGSVIVAGGAGLPDTAVAFGSASGGQKTAFDTANEDRIYDTEEGEGFTAAVLRGAKSMARRTATGSSFAITPLKSDAGNSIDTYVVFAGLTRFEEFAADAEVKAANQNARPRDVESNPLFTGGDLYLDGVIVHLDPSLPDDEAYLCGQNAVLLGWGKETSMIKDVTDYGHNTGIGYKEIRGMKKASVGGVQVGVVTIRFTAVTP